MGACAGNTKGKPEFKFERSDALWKEIRDYSFDTPSFKFMLEIQNRYTDVKGGFLTLTKQPCSSSNLNAFSTWLRCATIEGRRATRTRE